MIRRAAYVAFYDLAALAEALRMWAAGRRERCEFLADCYDTERRTRSPSAVVLDSDMSSAFVEGFEGDSERRRR